MVKRLVRRVFFLLVLPVIGCVGCFLALYTAGMPFHNYRLDQDDKVFRQMPHPSGTSLLKSFKEVSTANANDCGYLVGELRQFSGSRIAIQSFYADELKKDSRLKLLFVENGGLPANDIWSLPWAVNRISDWLASFPEPKDNLYFVYFFEIGDGFFDVRCS
jgi:hypothetical protein